MGAWVLIAVDGNATCNIGRNKSDIRHIKKNQNLKFPSARTRFQSAGETFQIDGTGKNKFLLKAKYETYRPGSKKEAPFQKVGLRIDVPMSD